MTSRTCFSLILALFVFSLCSVATLGQSQTSGRIVGTVVDEKGGAIPGAEVTVANKGTGETRNVVSDDSGHYIVPLLPPGVYTVSIVANGFKKFVADDVRVALTETSTLDATLAIGAVSESVGALEVDGHYRTSVPHIYAAGDAAGNAQLHADTGSLGRCGNLSS